MSTKKIIQRKLEIRALIRKEAAERRAKLNQANLTFDIYTAKKIIRSPWGV
jgi:hypothetical protein